MYKHNCFGRIQLNCLSLTVLFQEETEIRPLHKDTRTQGARVEHTCPQGQVRPCFSSRQRCGVTLPQRPTLTSLGGCDRTTVMCLSPALDCAGRDVGMSAPLSRARRRHPKTQVSRVIPRHNSQGLQQVRVPETCPQTQGYTCARSREVMHKER